MSTVSGHVAAAPQVVFATLAQGWFYSDWVVGTSHVRAVDDNWPDVGSHLHHATGLWPLALRDETQVEEMEQDRRLVLTARGRPFGEARVEIVLAPEGDGTRFTMTETPVSGPGRWLHNPLTKALLERRNVESLARFTALAERRTTPAE